MLMLLSVSESVPLTSPGHSVLAPVRVHALAAALLTCTSWGSSCGAWLCLGTAGRCLSELLLEHVSREQAVSRGDA